MVPWRISDTGLTLALRVTPRGGRDAIDGVDTLSDGRSVLRLRVRAIADGGEANRAVTELLAKSLGVPKGRVRLVSGATSRLKQIAVDGDGTALAAVTFYAVLPILRNAVVGLQGVDANLLESARGMGMSNVASLLRVRIPLAWPVILAGIRISLQMSMGIAAIAAYVLGPGLGVSIFTGLAQIGGKNAVSYAAVGTVGIVIVALLLDALLLLAGRLTTSKGIRV